MANILDRQIVASGPVNAIVKLTGVLDTSDVSLAPAVEVTDFLNEFPNHSLTGFRVMAVEYAISNDLQVLLAWDGVLPQQIAPIAGQGKIDACRHGGFRPDEDVDGYTGNINVTTSGYAPGTTQHFTILLTLKKIYAQ